MTHIIVGTAGHIDHGKTALVRALTGIDTDRLKEEKARGISIDLGFAHLDLGDGLRAGFVDVPGHERFVRNMLAGATGIDLVLFVVAADESIKPQTREHFEICRLLGLERGIVAVTKSDLVDADTLALVRMEIEEFVAGSFLEGAPMQPVSSVTGFGIPELKRDIAQIGGGASRKNVTRHFRMPVDRAFAMKGFGAVVTGTIIEGTVRLDQELEIHPLLERARVRGIQSHGEAAKEAVAGQRTALNLSGIDLADLHRGLVLAAPNVLRSTHQIGCETQLLRTAPPLKNRAPVHFHSGAAEIEGEVRLLDREEAKPGISVLSCVVLREPTLLLPGDRFVLRRFSPVETIGGGVVLDPQPPSLRRADLHSHLAALRDSGPRERLKKWVAESPYGVSRASLIARGGLIETELRGTGLVELPDWFLTQEAFAKLSAQLVAAVKEFHEQNPLAPGIPKEELRSRHLPEAPPFVLDALLKASQQLVVEGENVRNREHKLALKHEEDEALKKIEQQFLDAGLAVPATAEVLHSSGLTDERAQSLVQILLRQGRLVRVGANLIFHVAAIEKLKQILASRRSTRFTVAEFKEWTGISRKYAIPLLEYCDRLRITRRDGDERIVL